MQRRVDLRIIYVFSGTTFYVTGYDPAGVAESVDAADSKSAAARRGGSSPPPGTITALFSASACRLGEGRVPAASGARFWIIRRRNGKSCCDACSARASSPLPFWPCASHSRLHPSLRCLFAAALIARMEPSVALALPPPGAAVRSRRRCACLIAALVLNGKHFEKNR